MLSVQEITSKHELKGGTSSISDHKQRSQKGQKQRGDMRLTYEAKEAQSVWYEDENTALTCTVSTSSFWDLPKGS